MHVTHNNKFQSSLTQPIIFLRLVPCKQSFSLHASTYTKAHLENHWNPTMVRHCTLVSFSFPLLGLVPKQLFSRVIFILTYLPGDSSVPRPLAKSTGNHSVLCQDGWHYKIPEWMNGTSLFAKSNTALHRVSLTYGSYDKRPFVPSLLSRVFLDYCILRWLESESLD
jgi:hypothetical protein